MIYYELSNVTILLIMMVIWEYIASHDVFVSIGRLLAIRDGLLKCFGIAETRYLISLGGSVVCWLWFVMCVWFCFVGYGVSLVFLFVVVYLCYGFVFV